MIKFVKQHIMVISTAFIITLKVFSEQSQTNPLGILLMGLYGRTRIEGGEGRESKAWDKV